VKAIFGGVLLAGCLLWLPASALALARAGETSGSVGASRAPSGGPLISGNGQAVAPGIPAGAGEEATSGRPETETDPLVSNGLGSPLCKGLLGAGELSNASRRNCETSGFVAAPAPTGDYGLDVHIDTGLLGGFSSGGLLATVQDLFVSPVWMALVWAVHALVVMLEWAFTIDLLDAVSADGMSSGLRRALASFTQPWLPVVLAVASVVALYNGLILRRVAETVGQALLTLAMTVAGIWIALDPTGTLGALGAWANKASLGTLAVTAQGTPASAGRTLAGSMAGVFAAAIEAPWCYLEFGDVGWCRNPGRLDPRLHAAGVDIASSELALVGCKPGADPSACVSPGSEQGKALERSATLLRAAPTNGAIFLALPADGPARNSINEQSSLLRAMCRSSEATNCHGPMAAQAEFRTNGGTWKRVGGLLLIVAGAVGMLLLVGFIALRLLGAAIFSLLLLLLAPAVALTPALGEGGRMLFRRWAGQLLGAVVSKLFFSFLLGAVLAVLAILADLETLGWWTQWLLMSAFWWGVFVRRHQLLDVTGAGAFGELKPRPRSLARRAKEALETPHAALRGASGIRRKLTKPAPTVEERRSRVRAGRERARELSDAQVGRSLEPELEEARQLVRAASGSQPQVSSMVDRRQRLLQAREEADAAGDRRRAASLRAREAAIAEQVSRQRAALESARRVVANAEGTRRRTGSNHTSERQAERARFLDAQAALPAGGRRDRTGTRRDYPSLAGLAGYGRAQYERLDPRARRQARVQIDRELALRRELGGAAADLAASQQTDPLGRRARARAARDFEGALGERLRASGHRQPPFHADKSGFEAWKRARAASTRPRTPGQSSSVLDDAREVAARRKRQLGRNRP
jgi:hypothetical protein